MEWWSAHLLLAKNRVAVLSEALMQYPLALAGSLLYLGLALVATLVARSDLEAKNRSSRPRFDGTEDKTGPFFFPAAQEPPKIPSERMAFERLRWKLISLSERPVTWYDVKQPAEVPVKEQSALQPKQDEGPTEETEPDTFVDALDPVLPVSKEFSAKLLHESSFQEPFHSPDDLDLEATEVDDTEADREALVDAPALTPAMLHELLVDVAITIDSLDNPVGSKESQNADVMDGTNERKESIVKNTVQLAPRVVTPAISVEKHSKAEKTSSIDGERVESPTKEESPARNINIAAKNDSVSNLEHPTETDTSTIETRGSEEYFAVSSIKPLVDKFNELSSRASDLQIRNPKRNSQQSPMPRRIESPKPISPRLASLARPRRRMVKPRERSGRSNVKPKKPGPLKLPRVALLTTVHYSAYGRVPPKEKNKVTEVKAKNPVSPSKLPRVAYMTKQMIHKSVVPDAPSDDIAISPFKARPLPDFPEPMPTKVYIPVRKSPSKPSKEEIDLMECMKQFKARPLVPTKPFQVRSLDGKMSPASKPNNSAKPGLLEKPKMTHKKFTPRRLHYSKPVDEEEITFDYGLDELIGIDTPESSVDRVHETYGVKSEVSTPDRAFKSLSESVDSVELVRKLDETSHESPANVTQEQSFAENANGMFATDSDDDILNELLGDDTPEKVDTGGCSSHPVANSQSSPPPAKSDEPINDTADDLLDELLADTTGELDDTTALLDELNPHSDPKTCNKQSQQVSPDDVHDFEEYLAEPALEPRCLNFAAEE